MNTAATQPTAEVMPDGGTRTLLGHACVDSGQLLVTDPCYLDRWTDNEFDLDLPDLADAKGLAAAGGRYTASYDYHSVSVGVTAQDGVQVEGSLGVAFDTRGDGFYPVYLVVAADGSRSVVIELG